MLALWEFEWDESDWTGSATATDSFFGLLAALRWEGNNPTPSASATATASASLSLTIGGHGKKSNDYLGQPPDYWLAREQYLRHLVQSTVSTALPSLPEKARDVSQGLALDAAPASFSPPLELNGPAILQMQAMIAALNRAYTATNLQEMQEAGARAQALAIDIQKLRQQYIDRAVEILLLDVF